VIGCLRLCLTSFRFQDCNCIELAWILTSLNDGNRQTAVEDTCQTMWRGILVVLGNAAVANSSGQTGSSNQSERRAEGVLCDILMWGLSQAPLCGRFVAKRTGGFLTWCAYTRAVRIGGRKKGRKFSTANVWMREFRAQQ
jgi:hypothetical protein